jgi:MFS family permease
MAFCLAIYPIALTGVAQPEVPKDVKLSFRVTYRASQVAPVASGISGFVMGMAWSVGAVFATETLETPSAGSDFITMLLLGGICSLIPLGRLSDRVDRRFVVLGISLIGSAAGLYAWVDQPTYKMLMFTAFVIGATAMPLYSLAIAHANDNASTDFLVVGGTLLVANGIGAVSAPLIYAGLTATLWSHDIFFLFVGLGFLLNTVWTAYRLTFHSVARKYFEPYQPVSQTTLGAVELDPRAEHNESQNVSAERSDAIFIGNERRGSR